MNARPKEAAYIFKRTTGNIWIQQQKLTITDREDRFGQSVSIDENYAIIGAHYEYDPINETGAAFIFKNEEDTWVQKAKLTPIEEKINDLFGWEVSINGNFALIAAKWDDENGNGSGAVYVFKRNADDTWTQQQKLIASDGEKSDFFGSSIFIDEENVIIGAVFDDDNGDLSGSAYIFEKIVDDEKEDTSNGKTQTPGFELIISLIAIILVVLWRKKNHK